jgi:hypothetical protein
MSRPISTLVAVIATTLATACSDASPSTLADAGSVPMSAPIPGAGAGAGIGGGVPGAGGVVPAPGAPAPVPAPAAPIVPACVNDTHTVFYFDGRLIESVTNRGRLFNFEANGAPWPTNGMDLTAVPYYAAGPCAGRAPGTCMLDTRTFATFGTKLIEFVTAYGHSWAFDNGVPTDNGTDLATAGRYAEICALRPAGTACTFDTRSFVMLDGKLLESITAYGRYFGYDERGHRLADTGADLTQIPRYATGPCKGHAPGTCKLDTRTFGLVDGKVVEVTTAYGFVFRWLPAEPNAFSEIQPSSVPLTNIATWAAGPCK